MLKWLCAIISCTILIYGCIKSINKPISEGEIKSVGVGFEVFYNLKAKEKFAILYPPLPGIISYSTLNSIYQPQTASIIPSGNYFGLVSFMFAIETPNLIGSEILSTVGEENFKVIRYINILWVVLLLLFVSKGDIGFIGVLSLFLYPLTDIMMNSNVQILSALLVILVLELMNSILSCISYIKFILLGIVFGLLISVSGTNGFLFGGVAVISQIIWRDIEGKKLSKGFKKEWLFGSLLAIFTGMVVAWICYGMDLACFCQLQSLLGFEPTNSARVVPFFDSMKQIVFESVFAIYGHKYSFFGNLRGFFTIHNAIITTLSLFMMIKRFNQYGIFSIILILAICIYNDVDEDKIQIFFEITSIILTSLTGLSVWKIYLNSMQFSISKSII